MPRYRFVAVAIAVIVLLVVAACGGNDSDDAAPSGEAAAAETPSSEADGSASDAESSDGAPASEAGTTDDAAADSGTDSSQAEPVSAPEGATDFETAVTAARDEAQAAIDAADEAMTASPPDVAPEVFLRGPVAELVATFVDVMSGYADELAALEAPAEYAAEKERQVVDTRLGVELLEASLAAAEMGDEVRFNELEEDLQVLFSTLAAELSPEYSALAFLAPVSSDFDAVDAFGGLSEAELAYLEGVQQAFNEFTDRSEEFARTINRSYTTPESLLVALYDAGAGEAWAAVEAQAQELEPPERFAAEHAGWLELLEEQVRIDRLIGEAARDGQAADFISNNIRLGLLVPPDLPNADPAFTAQFSVPDPMYDGPDSEYLRALYDALLVHHAQSPVENVFGALGFPGLDQQAPAGIVDAGAELIAAVESSRAEVAALSPPEELAADHALVVAYFDAVLEKLDAVLAVAEAGDAVAVRRALEETNPFCDTSVELSDAIAASTDVHFDENSPFCNSG